MFQDWTIICYLEEAGEWYEGKENFIPNYVIVYEQYFVI